MSDSFARIRWSDLATRGFVHVSGFFAEADIQKLSKDFELQAAKSARNDNYNLPLVSPLLVWVFEAKLRAACQSIQSATGINADMTVGGLYFAIEKGVSFPWHQDHESYFIYQQHSDYLNFYIPFVKPEKNRSNLSLIPFDILKARIPAELFKRLVGAGATKLYVSGSETRVQDDENGIDYVLPVDIEEIKVTPEIAAGDLLLMRGDMIHRTQDVATPRRAVSFRRTRSDYKISKAKLLHGCPTKREMIAKNPLLYESVFTCFDELQIEEITAAQMVAYWQSRSVDTV